MTGELQRPGWNPLEGGEPPSGYEGMYIDSSDGPVLRLQYCRDCGDHTSLVSIAGELQCCACGREFAPEVCHA